MSNKGPKLSPEQMRAIQKSAFSSHLIPETEDKQLFDIEGPEFIFPHDVLKKFIQSEFGFSSDCASKIFDAYLEAFSRRLNQSKAMAWGKEAGAYRDLEERLSKFLNKEVDKFKARKEELLKEAVNTTWYPEKVKKKWLKGPDNPRDKGLFARAEEDIEIIFHWARETIRGLQVASRSFMDNKTDIDPGYNRFEKGGKQSRLALVQLWRDIKTIVGEEENSNPSDVKLRAAEVMMFIFNDFCDVPEFDKTISSQGLNPSDPKAISKALDRISYDN